MKYLLSILALMVAIGVEAQPIQRNVLSTNLNANVNGQVQVGSAADGMHVKSNFVAGAGTATGNQAFTFGDGDATGDLSFSALGGTASAEWSIAISEGTASGNHAIAISEGANVSGNYSVGIASGFHPVVVSGVESVSIGDRLTNSHARSFQFGQNMISQSDSNIQMGFGPNMVVIDGANNLQARQFQISDGAYFFGADDGSEIQATPPTSGRQWAFNKDGSVFKANGTTDWKGQMIFLPPRMTMTQPFVADASPGSDNTLTLRGDVNSGEALHQTLAMINKQSFQLAVGLEMSNNPASVYRDTAYLEMNAPDGISPGKAITISQFGQLYPGDTANGSHPMFSAFATNGLVGFPRRYTTMGGNIVSNINLTGWAWVYSWINDRITNNVPVVFNADFEVVNGKLLDGSGATRYYFPSNEVALTDAALVSVATISLPDGRAVSGQLICNVISTNAAEFGYGVTITRFTANASGGTVNIQSDTSMSNDGFDGLAVAMVDNGNNTFSFQINSDLLAAPLLSRATVQLQLNPWRYVPTVTVP